MMRGISIVLIVAIAIQTVGCTTWRPLVRVNKAADGDRQTSVRDHVLGKLNEGMAVRIRILEGTHLQIKSRVVDCIIEKIGPTSVKVTPMSFYAPGNVSRELTIHYSDIESIEYRESDDSKVFVTGLAAGAVVGILLLRVVLSGIELD